MAVLGYGGKLRLKREPAAPCAVEPDQIDFVNEVITSLCPGYWNGDHVEVDCFPGSDPDGYASYFGSKWELGGNRTQITAEDDIFYKTPSEQYPTGQFGDAAQFYVQPGSGPPCVPGDWWIHVDELGHISFYDSRCKALAGCLDDRQDIENIGDSFIITPYDSEWHIVCDLREWSVELSAPAVDTACVAEKWGNAVKSLVTGGGSTDFLIDRTCLDDNQENSIALMKLLLMTEKGCKAEAQFWMVNRGTECGVDCDLINGSLYYEADVLITQTAVNVRPTEIVAGTAQFVTTGAIRLLEAYPSTS